MEVFSCHLLVIAYTAANDYLDDKLLGARESHSSNDHGWHYLQLHPSSRQFVIIRSYVI